MASKLTITHADLDAEWSEVGASRRQCRAMHRFGRPGTIVFCRRPLGHDGDHRGHRAQWPEQEIV